MIESSRVCTAFFRLNIQLYEPLLYAREGELPLEISGRIAYIEQQVHFLQSSYENALRLLYASYSYEKIYDC